MCFCVCLSCVCVCYFSVVQDEFDTPSSPDVGEYVSSSVAQIYQALHFPWLGEHVLPLVCPPVLPLGQSLSDTKLACCFLVHPTDQL